MKTRSPSAPDSVTPTEAGASLLPRDGTRRARPRRLGDAWVGWTPSQAVDDPEQVAAGSSLLLAVLGLLSLLAAGAWVLLLWLAAPRLASLGLEGRTLIGLGAGGAVAVLLPCLLLWGAWLPLRYPVALARALQRYVFGTWTLAAALGRPLRISRDRLGHSFVRVTNQLALRVPSTLPGAGLLILAPRCLKADHMRALRQLAGERGAELVVAGGGEEARAAIYAQTPAGVLAIACERDLVAGLRDVAARLPVLSLPNQRPEGPCRNSTIDLRAVRLLLTRLEELTRP